jgi:hypothetical protein
MGLADTFQRELRAQLRFHAAWYPVANTFRVGTYGLVEGGVLRPLGHVADDFGVDLGESQASPAAGPSAFESAGVVTVRTVAGAAVNALPDVGDLDAKLSFTFKNANSAVFKAATLTLEEMPSVNRVAHLLAGHPTWEKRFRIVSGVYRAEAPVVLIASEAGTTVAFDGKVSALKLIEGGNADVSFNISSSSEKCFRTAGKPGVVGLALFRVGWFGGPKVLGDAPVDDGKNWPALEDDI